MQIETFVLLALKDPLRGSIISSREEKGQVGHKSGHFMRGQTSGHGIQIRTWDTNPDMGHKSGHGIQIQTWDTNLDIY